ADHADRGASDQEHTHDRSLRGTHGTQDRDIAALVLHQHDQPRHDVQRCDQHDHGEDQEHHIALDLERVEEGGVTPPPVHQKDRPSGGFGHGLAETVDLVGIVGKNLDRGYVVVAIEV